MNSILTIIFIALYVYTLTSTISVLLLENRNPVKSLSWVLVLLFLPGLGLFLYLIARAVGFCTGFFVKLRASAL